MLSFKPPSVVSALNWIVDVSRGGMLSWREVEETLILMMEEDDVARDAATLVLVWTYSISGLFSHLGLIEKPSLMARIADTGVKGLDPGKG